MYPIEADSRSQPSEKLDISTVNRILAREREDDDALIGGELTKPKEAEELQSKALHTAELGGDSLQDALEKAL